jgi:hypothetical protein
MNAALQQWWVCLKKERFSRSQLTVSIAYGGRASRKQCFYWDLTPKT